MVLSKSGVLIRSLPEAAFTSKVDARDGSLTIRFVLKELKSVLSDSGHDIATLSLSLFEPGQNAESKRVTFTLETPPSQIDTKLYFPATLFEAERKITIPDEYRRVSMPGFGDLELIGLIEVTGQDERGFQAAVPFQLTHALNLVSTKTSVGISECGHSVSTSRATTKLDSSMWLIPLGSKVDQVQTSVVKTGSSMVTA